MFTVSLILSFIASILLISASVFGLIKDWKNQVMRYYAFFAMCAFGILFTMFLTYALPDSQHLTTINKITQVSTTMCFSCLLALSFVFPKREIQFPFSYTILMLIPAFVVSYIALFTDWNITRAYFQDNSFARDFNFFYRYYAIIVFTYLLLGLGNFIIKYIRTTISIHRLQMRYVFVGTAVGMTIASVFSIILPLVFKYSDLYVLGPSLAALFAIGAFFYAIISYNLMDITTAIHKTTMYIIISTVIFVPMYGVLTLFESNFPYISEVPVYIIAALLVAVFIIFSIYVQPYIDKLFRRRQFRFEAVIDTFIRDVETIKDFKSIIQRTVDILYESLFLKHAFFIIFNNEKRLYELYYLKGENVEVGSLERNSPLIRWFVRNQEALHIDRVYVDDEQFSEIRDHFVSFYNTNRIRIVLPIYHQRTILGLICLGDKDTLAAYKPDEISKLNFFQKESNVHISNSVTYEEAIKEQFMNRTLELSSTILSRAIPLSLPNMMGIKFGAFYVPKYGEGVDYFDFLRPGSQGIGCIATDISGVGINSALYSVVLRSAFQSSIHEAPSSYSVLQRLSNVLYQYSQGKGGFITAFYYYFDIKTMRLIYSNAGFPPLEIYRIEKNDFDSLDTEGIPLGYDPKANYGMGRTFLLRGDIGVLYSKALTSSKNQKGEVFGVNRLRSIVKENRALRPSEIAGIINDRFTAYMGISSPESDILAIVFKVV